MGAPRDGGGDVQGNGDAGVGGNGCGTQRPPGGWRFTPGQRGRFDRGTLTARDSQAGAWGSCRRGRFPGTARMVTWSHHERRR